MASRSVGLEPAAFRISATPAGTNLLLFAAAALTALRPCLAAYLPLSFDEAYFWTWSKHLATAYYDHPPMIAFAIKLGTALFGDTEIGVRFVPLAASAAASWAVWQAATIALASDEAGALACALFNLTLMVAAETMAATPDALVVAASALLLLAMVKLEESGDGRWWLAAGGAIAFALESKYTGFFLGAGVALWLVATPQGRAWLRTPWPYAAGAIALCAFVPTILWNAGHDWISFRFQFGRITTGGIRPGYLLEFLASQIALASPFILVLAIVGLVRASKGAGLSGPLAISAMLVWPAVAYFSLHALHDRVQGNWPSFVYPALALLAASVLPRDDRRGTPAAWLRMSRAFALPAALLILAVIYAQVFFGLVPLGKSDPIARMTAVGIQPVTRDIANLAERDHAAAIVTTKYVVTGWLKFYLPDQIPVVQINHDYRFLAVPRADARLLEQPLLYVTQHPEKEAAAVREHFSTVRPLATIWRTRGAKPVDRFYVYALAGFHGAPIGRVP